MSLIPDHVLIKPERLLATVSAHVILIDRQSGGDGSDRILLGQLAYRDHRQGKWSFPGGYMDQGEALETALCREVREETGMTLLSWNRLDIRPMLHYEHPHISFLYSSDDWQGQPACLTREFLDLRWADETFYRTLVREDALAYPCMSQQVTFLGWNF